MATNTINQITYSGRIEEALAASALSPGHLIEVLSAGTVQKQSSLGGAGPVLVALSDTLQGRLATAAFASGELVKYKIAAPGEVFQVRLPASAVAVSKGDLLIPDGAGCVIKRNISTGLLYSNTAASAAVSNTTTETAFDKSYTIPANSLQVGDVIRVRCQVIATSTNSTDTLKVKGYLASINLQDTGALDVADSDVVFIDLDLIVRTIGASGTFVGAGIQTIGTPGTATMKHFKLASSAIDTTTTNAITFKATWSVASASNSCRLDVLDVQLLRSSGPCLPKFVAVEAIDNSAGTSEAFLSAMALA